MENLKPLLITVFLFNASVLVHAQVAPTIQWQKSFGGSLDDLAYSIQQTKDGGYIVIGNTFSMDGDVSESLGNSDVWVLRLNSSGNLEWDKSYGGSDHDFASSIVQTMDGGFVFSGNTFSKDGDVSGSHDGGDYWVVKLDSVGNIVWQNALGGSNYDWAKCVRQTADSGFIVVGTTNSSNGNVIGNHGSNDVWIVKLNKTGKMSWKKCYGGEADDRGNSVQQTIDGGYIVAASVESTGGNVSGKHGLADYWVIKLDSVGQLLWQNCLGGSNYDWGVSVVEIPAGGYMVAGSSASQNHDVSDHWGNNDDWVVRIDPDSNLIWGRSYGGFNNESGIWVDNTADGNFLTAAWSESNDGDVSGHHGDFTHFDYWVAEFDSGSNILWQKSLGGTLNDYIEEVHQTSDGGYIMIGSSDSQDGDVSGNHGGLDYWVVKLSGATNVGIQNLFPNLPVISPNPVHGNFKVTFANAALENADLIISNLIGEAILQKKISGDREIYFSASDLTPGVYLLTVSSPTGKFISKFIRD